MTAYLRPWQGDWPGTRFPALSSRVWQLISKLQGKDLAANSWRRRRCLRLAAEGGGILLIIDAKSERAAQWYRSYGAEPLADKPLTLVMPLAAFTADLKAKGLLG